MRSFRSFWRRSQATWKQPPAIPDDHRVYAVGDIHGQDHLLAELLARIGSDIAARPGPAVTIVFLGDLIDRGPNSAQVIERLRTYRPDGLRTVFLVGNHEEVLLRILDGDGGLIGDWLTFGGLECVRSYGLEASALSELDPDAAVALLRSAIPMAHRDFLAGFADTFRAGDYLFVHAGIRPGIALADQSQADLRWIREPFLDHPGRHDTMVVHGHTISRKVDERAGRIGIDTGAYKHGVLTALVLEGTRRDVLQASDEAGR